MEKGIQKHANKMKRFIENYKGKEFDLIVIGGGITGATVAYEAASRGISVALVEKSDFSSATSSATSKMIHGGLRYLSTMEFALVRESLRERRILSNIAPNFIHPIPFIYSIYKRDKTSSSTIKIGMLLYELFAFDKNRLWDKNKKMPSHKSLSAPAVLKLVPKAINKDLVGAQMYYDCISHSPERLTLAFIKSAVKYGAEVANYTEVEGFIVENSRKFKTVKGVKVKDKLSGKSYDIKAKLVINCAGPWADIILNKAKENIDNQILRRSEGIHFITKKIVNNHIFTGATAKGKHFFLVPYRNHTLIGTTDKEYIGNPDAYHVTKDAIMELLIDVNESFGNQEKIAYKDILHAYGGLRPLVEDQTEDVYNTSRKYEITGEKKNGIKGLITVEGGKFTTSRMLAKKAINKVQRILRFSKHKSISKDTYLTTSNIENFDDFIKIKKNQYKNFPANQIEYLAQSYGTEIDAIFTIANNNEYLLKPLNPDGENLAQVLFAIKNEMALSLSDILLRRTGIAQLGHPGKETLEKVAKLAAKELSWDHKKMELEIDNIEKILKIPE